MLEQRTQPSCPEAAAACRGTELSPRIRGLREMYWAKTHASKVLVKELTSSAEPTFVAKARNFELRLEESPPLIQDDELLAGVALVRPKDLKAFDLGYYNSHYPPGHPNMLRLGFSGIRDRARQKLAAETDPKKRDFLEAVAISYDAACRFAQKYATYLRRLSAETLDPGRRRELDEIAEACEQVAEGPPRTFHAALQQFWFVFMFGGCGCIGRFDQWMYPFLRRDLDEGRLTKAQAQELLDSLWIKLNFFAGNNDSLRNIALAGQTADGQDGCNELTYMCLEATEKLRLPEPKVAVRFFRGSPRPLLEIACRVNAKGLSMPSLFNDEVAIPALRRLGIPLDDARQYCNDGCEELIIGSKCAITFSCFDSVALLNETVFRAEQRPYASFDEVLADYKERLKRWMPDNHGQPQHITFPFFAGAIDDCLENATTEPRYSIWGNILSQTANTADGLMAIKKLIFDAQALTWPELIAALRANWEGYEPLRQMILNRAPKFGNDIAEVDRLAIDIAEYFMDGVHAHAKNPPGHGPKRATGLMSFGLQSRRQLPATADGRRQGDVTANSFSPAVGRDKSGPTAVINSTGRLDATKASHGATLDIALHTTGLTGPGGLQKLIALADAMLKKGGITTLQINVIDRETLLKAKADPKNPAYRTLIVRVWGFSAVFPELIPDLQDHVIQRTEHAL